MSFKDYGREWNPATPWIQFHGDDGEKIGALWYRDGVFSFEGNADDSIKAFMLALNGWGESFVPRFDMQRQRDQLQRVTESANTLAAHFDRMKLSMESGDRARLDKQIAEAAKWLDKHRSDFDE